MAKLRSYRFFGHITLVFIGVYVLCVLTNILILPSRAVLLGEIKSTIHASSNDQGDGAIHGSRQAVVKLLDRSVPGKIQVVTKPSLLVLLFVFTGLLLSGIAHTLRPPSVRLLFNHRRAYLSLQMLLI